MYLSGIEMPGFLMIYNMRACTVNALAEFMLNDIMKCKVVAKAGKGTMGYVAVSKHN